MTSRVHADSLVEQMVELIQTQGTAFLLVYVMVEKLQPKVTQDTWIANCMTT
jgi:hypothetical protein